MADLWSWLRYRWNRTTEEMDRTDGTILVTVVSLMLAVWFAWRLTRGREGAGRKPAAAAGPPFFRLGADSEFYRIESRLARLGWTRAAPEPLSDWLEKIARQNIPGLDAGTARQALRLHYRYRFDPDGITPGDRAELSRLAGRVAAALDQAAGSASRSRSSAK